MYTLIGNALLAKKRMSKEFTYSIVRLTTDLVWEENPFSIKRDCSEEKALIQAGLHCAEAINEEKSLFGVLFFSSDKGYKPLAIAYTDPNKENRTILEPCITEKSEKVYKKITEKLLQNLIRDELTVNDSCSGENIGYL